MGKAQRNVAVGTPFTQTFGGLGAGTFTDNSTLTGWYLNSGSITLNDGTDGTPGPYVFRLAGQRAFGGVGDGTTLGWRVRNNSATTVQCIRVTYTGEQWRVGESGGAVGTLDFAYSTGSTVTSLSGGFTAVGGLTFTSPQTNPTCGAGGAALNGNLPANQGAVTHLITGLNIPAGEEIMLRWTTTGPGGCAGHGLGVDAVTVETFSLDTPPVTSPPH